MTLPPDHDPLGPERRSPDSPRGSDAEGASARPRLSRIEEEVERLRRSPTPTRDGGRPKGSDFFANGAPLMGIFSRTRDIIAANFNDMLDKADDPQKMIRMIIHRHTVKLDKLQADWNEKAQLALSKDREDLARAALVEKKKAADMSDQLKQEIAVLDDALRAYEQDIQKLQNRLREARSRQTAIAARLESAENRVKLRSLMTNERVDDALTRFDQLERRVDYAEGRADALSIADQSDKPSLADEIAALEGADAIDDELEQMKKALGMGSADKED